MSGKRIALFSLVDQTKFGGSSVYTAHLYRCLQRAGWEPTIFRITNRTAKRGKPFTHGLHYYNLSIEDALMVSTRMPAHICYAHWKTHRDVAAPLLRRGLSITIHDPHDFFEDQFSIISKSGSKVVAIRRTNEQAMRKAGLKEARFIPHPYVSPGVQAGTRKYHAVFLASVYYRKRQHIAIVANQLLDREHRVHFWGTWNRQYAYWMETKKGIDLSWKRDYYHGTLEPAENASLVLLAQASFALDLTVMGHGDGDGSQYLFLEAWDAGVPLIVHRGWILTGTDEVREGETALAVETPEELARVLSVDVDRKALIAGGREQLQHHTWDQVVPQYEEVFRGV